MQICPRRGTAETLCNHIIVFLRQFHAFQFLCVVYFPPPIYSVLWFPILFVVITFGICLFTIRLGPVCATYTFFLPSWNRQLVIMRHIDVYHTLPHLRPLTSPLSSVALNETAVLRTMNNSPRVKLRFNRISIFHFIAQISSPRFVSESPLCTCSAKPAASVITPKMESSHYFRS